MENAKKSPILAFPCPYICHSRKCPCRREREKAGGPRFFAPSEMSVGPGQMEARKLWVFIERRVLNCYKRRFLCQLFVPHVYFCAAITIINALFDVYRGKRRALAILNARKTIIFLCSPILRYDRVTVHARSTRFNHGKININSFLRVFTLNENNNA